MPGDRIREAIGVNVSTADARGGTDGCGESADDEYRLISIRRGAPPEGCGGNDWHIYRIAQGENDITGYRCGDLAHVRIDVEAIVTALNERRQWTKSKATSTSQRRAAASARARSGT